MVIRDKVSLDEAWIRELLQERWGGNVIAVHGEATNLMNLPALVAGQQEGLATYRVDDDEADLLSLDAVLSGRGIGTALLTALASRLREHGVKRLWVTTNSISASIWSATRRVKRQRISSRWTRASRSAASRSGT